MGCATDFEVVNVIMQQIWEEGILEDQYQRLSLLASLSKSVGMSAKTKFYQDERERALEDLVQIHSRWNSQKEIKWKGTLICCMQATPEEKGIKQWWSSESFRNITLLSDDIRKNVKQRSHEKYESGAEKSDANEQQGSEKNCEDTLEQLRKVDIQDLPTFVRNNDLKEVNIGTVDGWGPLTMKIDSDYEGPRGPYYHVIGYIPDPFNAEVFIGKTDHNKGVFLDYYSWFIKVADDYTKLGNDLRLKWENVNLKFTED
ncbi:hypothetical protein BKA69DRAFT_1084283, partial [Paraphysoderma sedebokerense]